MGANLHWSSASKLELTPPMQMSNATRLETALPTALTRIEERRAIIAAATPQRHKSALGQFMTPGAISTFMAGMFTPFTGKKIRLLDAGAGIGSLTAMFAIRAADERVDSLQCEAWELDAELHEPLDQTLKACGSLIREAGGAFRSDIQSEDFILAFGNLFQERPRMDKPTHAILNPPYKKISSQSPQRFALRSCGVETTNLYSAFVALALKSLDEGGELVAITPRSFCNGTYFRPFRKLILDRSSIVKVHVFESRTRAFKGDEVLQENVIFHLAKGAKQGDVVISTSEDASFAGLSTRVVPFDQIVQPGDRERIIHLPTREAGKRTAEALSRYRFTLEQLGLSVSTGPVVDFRMRDYLRAEPGAGRVPMIHTHHFDGGFVSHPKLDAKKPNWIEINEETRKWLMPGGSYVVVRRLSSKEETRRIVPAVFDPAKVPEGLIGFDNKTNVVHQDKHGMPVELAKGLAIYLGSTFADQWLRRFSGHTQVNAGDLRTLRYPDIETLLVWGNQVGDVLPCQAEIDNLVGGSGVQDQ